MLQDGTTALLLASKNGQQDIVELILSNKAEVSAKDEVSSLYSL